MQCIGVTQHLAGYLGDFSTVTLSDDKQLACYVRVKSFQYILIIYFYYIL